MTRTGRVVAFIAGLGFVMHAAADRAAAPKPSDEVALRVLVTEAPGIVRLRIMLPEDVPPGSVEVEIEGRSVVVLARRLDGRRLCSRRLRLSHAAVEAGAQADYEPDGSLTITFRTARPGGL
ncbi:MAG TPA: hypothetical protein VMS22_08390 [Candidatus Eisenbacteria bacterium]|nr:hypothetical protein [Candidatus Eisenbacteria bacterium]